MACNIGESKWWKRSGGFGEQQYMKVKPALYTRYPVSSILIYNGITLLHFLLGGTGLILGYSHRWGYLSGAVYLVFAFGEMYILMPLKVCPDCPYSKLDKSLCISGLNVLSRRLVKAGDIKQFSLRAKGAFCPNNLYLASLGIPILALMPALILNFSFLLLTIWIAVVGLLVFRFLVVFPRLACGHAGLKISVPTLKQWD
jgi:hypothetical protein